MLNLGIGADILSRGQMLRQSRTSKGPFSRKFLENQVGGLGLRSPIHVAPNVPIREVIRIFRDEGIGSVLIVDELECLLGIFTERDLMLRVLRRERNLSDPISDVMTAGPDTILATASIARALHMIGTRRFRHIPVTSSGKRVTGVLSVKDLLRFIHQRVTAPLLEVDSLPLDPGFASDFLAGPVSQLPLHAAPLVSSSTLIGEVLELFVRPGVTAAAVIGTNQAIEGIITERDIVRGAAHLTSGLKIPIEVLMTRSPVVVGTSNSMMLALSILGENGYRHLPVVDESTNIVIALLGCVEVVRALIGSLLEDLENPRKPRPA